MRRDTKDRRLAKPGAEVAVPRPALPCPHSNDVPEIDTGCNFLDLSAFSIL
jgi:hypothetical protein